MWFLGHTALSLLLVLPLIYLGGKGVDRSRFYLLVFFANLPDFFHLGVVRDYTSHNIFGALVLFALAAYAFRDRVGWPEALAYFSHFVGDLLFGSFMPFFPFVRSNLSLWPWNGWLDTAAELVLGAALLIAFALLLRRRGTVVGKRLRLAFRAVLALFAAQVAIFAYLNYPLFLSAPVYPLWLAAGITLCIMFYFGLGRRDDRGSAL